MCGVNSLSTCDVTSFQNGGSIPSTPLELMRDYSDLLLNTLFAGRLTLLPVIVASAGGSNQNRPFVVVVVCLGTLDWGASLSFLSTKHMNDLLERVAFLNMFRGCQVKTPSKNGGLYFSYAADDAKVIESNVEAQSIGEFIGFERLGERIEGEIVWKVKAVVDFSKVRDLNNGAECFEAHEVIPLLKPLSALTDDDCLELARIDGYDEQVIVLRPEAVVRNVKAAYNLEGDLLFSPKATLWLAMNSYDVLGWIPKGNAIELKQVA